MSEAGRPIWQVRARRCAGREPARRDARFRPPGRGTAARWPAAPAAGRWSWSSPQYRLARPEPSVARPLPQAGVEGGLALAATGRLDDGRSAGGPDRGPYQLRVDLAIP